MLCDARIPSQALASLLCVIGCGAEDLFEACAQGLSHLNTRETKPSYITAEVCRRIPARYVALLWPNGLEKHDTDHSIFARGSGILAL